LNSQSELYFVITAARMVPSLISPEWGAQL